MSTLQNSTFLEYTSYGATTATTVAEAYHLQGPEIPATVAINVAFTLPRANDPTALLHSDWATRQTTLAELNASNSLWSTYGASPADYAAARAMLAGHGTLLGDAAGSDGYISSPESRTIWVSLTPVQFNALFSTTLYQGTTNQPGPTANPLYYWNGSLSLPDGLDVDGLWLDTIPWFGTPPAISDMSGGAVANLFQGVQSLGNSLAVVGKQTNLFPGEMAEWVYNFPLSNIAAGTPTVGVIEPLIGDALPPGASYTFQQGLDSYRGAAGLSTSGNYYIVANNGQSYEGNSGERALDVGVVASAAPGSRIGLYAGSGTGGHATSNVFTSFQAAFWDTANAPSVISSSYAIFQQTAPGSPFAAAARELFVDAVLRNITVIDANNDYGSSWAIANGLANQAINASSPFVVWVGGTSVTTLESAPKDGSLAELYGQAMAGDPAVLWELIQSGLMRLPSATSPSQASQNTLLEAVWNSFMLVGSLQTPPLGASDGGVDTTQPVPSYQSAFGLLPTSVNPSHGIGRGAPDVSADAGGNMAYISPLGDMVGLARGAEGTSASAPLWAALMAQIDAIFLDQDLPQLGYMNDLLYAAAAIAPASFNDITVGNNVTSFKLGGPTLTENGEQITLTGFGYHAVPGYDLTTGLGSPNGTLLARALTTIAHSQMSFGSSPDMLEADGGGWTSGTDQSLMFQSMSGSGADIDVSAGAGSIDFFSGVSGTFAWTTRFAQQALQADFDPQLVRLFDKQAHGWVAQHSVSAGEGLAVTIGASAAQALQGTLTSPFGFAEFVGGDGVLRVARPVAVAETAGAQDDQVAVVRLRQNGEDSLSLSFYRVDDLNGTIDGLRPGEPGYHAASSARAYHTTAGGTSISGPGYGNYAQTALIDIDAGDLIAMRLTNNTTGNVYWAFAQANETVNGQHVGHLWNYGLNTWGWEDLRGGGDRDFNDLVVQFDFTSASGHGWLV
jgi:hypothetical protein